MNNMLEMKGKRFVQASKQGSGGGVSMHSAVQVTSETLLRLQSKITDITHFWEQEVRPFEGVLITVLYNKIVAKSNRISGLFKGKNSHHAIVGAKFNKEKSKHIITYFLEMKDLVKSINLLATARNILDEQFEGCMNKSILDNKVAFNAIPFQTYGISKTVFKQIIADVSYIDDFEVAMVKDQFHQSIITLYHTDISTKVLLKRIGIDVLDSRILDNHTVFLDKNQIELLLEKAPYLISMATENTADLSPDDFLLVHDQHNQYIPAPNREPTIGVIDTLFDQSVYFHQWVEYHHMVDPNILTMPSDYQHGTAVSSLIVDGPRLNPWLDDGCGRFKVRHFGVASAAYFSSFTIIKQIKEIIASNRDIKVWNFCLGSSQEVNDNFISAEAAVLDQIQYEHDVIFVIAGTNKPHDSIVKIGSPADSINSMVVNAVTKSGLSTNYARKGLALSFFAKPDVSYYGGSEEAYIKACKPSGVVDVAGTSFAAPWIARKLSYLIDILGLNREVAKAVIIDAARGWHGKPTPETVALYGHGTVPIKMHDIIQTPEDEIKFLVSDVSEKWNTYNYHFPVPLKNDKYPYIAKATMCYFPLCNRSQGVDYTNTELNLHFGRIQNDGTIKDITGDTQNQKHDALISPKHYLLEGEARNKFRKWDNVKYLSEQPKSRMRPKKSYNNKNWGMEIKTNNRLDPQDGVGVRFGVVVTFKEMNGMNRIDEFIRNCDLDGWLVKSLDIKTRIALHEKIHESIELE